MADYTKVGPFVNDSPPKLNATNLNTVESGIKDAAEHQNSGTIGARPTADAAHKHHIWIATDDLGGTTSYYCDGTKWIQMAPSSAGVNTVPAKTTHYDPGTAQGANEQVLNGIGQKFVTGGGGGTLTAIKMQLQRDNLLTSGTITVELRADNAGVPAAAVTKTLGRIDSLAIAKASEGVYSEIVLPCFFTLAASTTYHIVLKETQVGGKVSANRSSAGTGLSTSDISNNWTAQARSIMVTMIETFDGQTVDHVADATKGVEWKLKWRARASAWEFIGGGYLTDKTDTGVDTSYSNTTYGTSAALATVTAPLPGDYHCLYGMMATCPGAGVSNGYYCLKFAGTADTAFEVVFGNGNRDDHNWNNDKTGIAAGATVILAVHVDAGSAVYTSRFVRIRPTKVY